MMNLGLGDQSKGGSLLDTVLQIAFPAYGVMRNTQAFFEPEHREGTTVGWGMDKLEQPGGLFGSDQPQGGGLIGTTPDVGGYGYDTYNYGNGDIGVEHTGGDNSSAQSDYSNVSWDNMTDAEASSWDDY